MVSAAADYRPGLRVGLVFAVPTLFLGISFGVLARSLGWGTAAPIVSSAVVFSGSAQFAVASILAAGGGALAAIVAAVLVNARFAPMGLAAAQSLKGGRLRRALEAQAIVDASWAAASRDGGRFDREVMIGATLPQYVAWFGGTVIGVVAGPGLGDPSRFGLDAVFPAFFLALLAEELRDKAAWAAALAAAAIALALMPFAPPGVPVVAASAAALIALARR
jgi:4-azaleucine resistance transporter AzlC